MNVRSVDKHFSEILDPGGLDQRRLHGLRLVFTTLMDAGGVSEQVTMQAAGHKTPAMTRYYQNPMESQLADAAGRLDEQVRRVAWPVAWVIAGEPHRNANGVRMRLACLHPEWPGLHPG